MTPREEMTLALSLLGAAGLPTPIMVRPATTRIMLTFDSPLNRETLTMVAQTLTAGGIRCEVEADRLSARPMPTAADDARDDMVPDDLADVTKIALLRTA